jgi:acid phosphatase
VVKDFTLRPKNNMFSPRKSLSVLVMLAVCQTVAPAADKPPRYDHVVIVIEENKNFDQVVAGSKNPRLRQSAPFINGTLIPEGALFRRMYGEEHHSQGNYFWLFCGARPKTLKFNDATPAQTVLNIDNLGSQLRRKGLSFKGYAEDQPMKDGRATLANYSDSNPFRHEHYARKHVPWVSFPELLPYSLPFSAFPKDFSKLPTVSFVIPNLTNDMHNGKAAPAVASGDQWLKNNLRAYYRWAKKHNSLLIVTFDENDDKPKTGLTSPTADEEDDKNRTVTIFAGAHIKPGTNSDQPINHVTILRTIEAMYGLPKLGGRERVGGETHSSHPDIITGVFSGK